MLKLLEAENAALKEREQAAFEKWLHDKCPSGDVESVQLQWLRSHEFDELLDDLEYERKPSEGED